MSSDTPGPSRPTRSLLSSSTPRSPMTKRAAPNGQGLGVSIADVEFERGHSSIREDGDASTSSPRPRNEAKPLRTLYSSTRSIFPPGVDSDDEAAGAAAVASPKRGSIDLYGSATPARRTTGLHRVRSEIPDFPGKAHNRLRGRKSVAGLRTPSAPRGRRVVNKDAKEQQLAFEKAIGKRKEESFSEVNGAAGESAVSQSPSAPDFDMLFRQARALADAVGPLPHSHVSQEPAKPSTNGDSAKVKAPPPGEGHGDSVDDGYTSASSELDHPQHAAQDAGYESDDEDLIQAYEFEAVLLRAGLRFVLERYEDLERREGLAKRDLESTAEQHRLRGVALQEELSKAKELSASYQQQAKLHQEKTREVLAEAKSSRDNEGARQEAVEKAQKEREAAEETAAVLRKENEEQAKRIDTLQKLVQGGLALKTQLAQTSRDKVNAEETVTGLRTRNDDLVRRIGILEKAAQNNGELGVQLTTANRERAAAEKQTADLRKRLSELENAVQGGVLLTSQLTQANKDRDAAEKSTQGLRKYNEELIARIATLEKSVQNSEAAEKQVADLRREKNAIEDNMISLRVRNDELSRQVGELDKSSQDSITLKSELAQAQQQNQRAEEAMQLLRKRNEELSNRISALETSLTQSSSVSASLGQAEERHRNLQSEMQTLQSAKVDLERQLAERAGAHESALKQSSALSTLLDEATQRQRSLDGHIASLRASNEELERQVQGHRTVETERSELKRKVEELTGLLHEARMQALSPPAQIMGDRLLPQPSHEQGLGIIPSSKSPTVHSPLPAEEAKLSPPLPANVDVKSLSHARKQSNSSLGSFRNAASRRASKRYSAVMNKSPNPARDSIYSNADYADSFTSFQSDEEDEDDDYESVAYGSDHTAAASPSEERDETIGSHETQMTSAPTSADLSMPGGFLGGDGAAPQKANAAQGSRAGTPTAAKSSPSEEVRASSTSSKSATPKEEKATTSQTKTLLLQALNILRTQGDSDEQASNDAAAQHDKSKLAEDTATDRSPGETLAHSNELAVPSAHDDAVEQASIYGDDNSSFIEQRSESSHGGHHYADDDDDNLTEGEHASNGVGKDSIVFQGLHEPMETDDEHALAHRDAIPSEEDEDDSDAHTSKASHHKSMSTRELLAQRAKKSSGTYGDAQAVDSTDVDSDGTYEDERHAPEEEEDEDEEDDEEVESEEEEDEEESVDEARVASPAPGSINTEQLDEQDVYDEVESDEEEESEASEREMPPPPAITHRSSNIGDNLRARREAALKALEGGAADASVPAHPLSGSTMMSRHRSASQMTAGSGRVDRSFDVSRDSAHGRLQDAYAMQTPKKASRRRIFNNATSSSPSSQHGHSSSHGHASMPPFSPPPPPLPTSSPFYGERHEKPARKVGKSSILGNMPTAPMSAVRPGMESGPESMLAHRAEMMAHVRSSPGSSVRSGSGSGRGGSSSGGGGGVSIRPGRRGHNAAGDSDSLSGTASGSSRHSSVDYSPRASRMPVTPLSAQRRHDSSMSRNSNASMQSPRVSSAVASPLATSSTVTSPTTPKAEKGESTSYFAKRFRRKKT